MRSIYFRQRVRATAPRRGVLEGDVVGDTRRVRQQVMERNAFGVRKIRYEGAESVVGREPPSVDQTQNGGSGQDFGDRSDTKNVFRCERYTELGARPAVPLAEQHLFFFDDEHPPTKGSLFYVSVDESI